MLNLNWLLIHFFKCVFSNCSQKISSSNKNAHFFSIVSRIRSLNTIYHWKKKKQSKEPLEKYLQVIYRISPGYLIVTESKQTTVDSGGGVKKTQRTILKNSQCLKNERNNHCNWSRCIKEKEKPMSLWWYYFKN